MHPGAEQIIWSCGAASAKRSYQVAQLNRSATNFELIIYDGPMFDDVKYVETIKITIENTGEQKLIGSGRTSTDKTIKVTAFGGSVKFNVDDEEFGFAYGKCNRNVELN